MLTTAMIDDRIREIETEVADALAHAGLALVPKAVSLSTFTDPLDEEAWRVTLTLPKPDGPTWDREEVFAARWAAARTVDGLVDGTNLELPGSTLAIITVDPADVDASDVATDEPTEIDDEQGE